MVAAAVGADDVLLGTSGVTDRDFCEAGVVQLLRGPVQQRQVHHAVDDHPAPDVPAAHPLALLAVPRTGPGADEFSNGIKTPRQKVCGVHPDFPGIFIAGQAVVRQGGQRVHKPNIMVKPFITFKSLIQTFLYGFGGFSEGFVFGGMVCLPEHPRPEPVAPPINAGGGG